MVSELKVNISFDEEELKLLVDSIEEDDEDFGELWFKFKRALWKLRKLKKEQAAKAPEEKPEPKKRGRPAKNAEDGRIQEE